MLISLDNVAFGYGDNLIFGGVTFSVNERERIGLIGANGEGKTTLLKVLTGLLPADSGEVFLKNGARVGYLAQNGGYRSGNTVYAEMLGVFKEDFAAIEKLSYLSLKLAELDYSGEEYARTSAKIESLEKFLSARDGYNAEVRIKTVLNGMGFAGSYGQVIDTMSGGEKTRLKLARLLLENPDLLVLDEPTNHLDIPTLFWLEDYLQTYKGAVIVVSHDRYFLDRICGKILELENKKLTEFPGNYSKYKLLKAERVARLVKEYEAQREEIAKLRDYVDRNIVRATTAKSAQSRVKQLERMEILEKPYIPPKPPAFSFTFSERSYEEVLSISALDLKVGQKTLISGGEMSLTRGTKAALVGENGAGKSTLLKEITARNPAIRLGRYVKIALFDQEGLNLNPENTVLAELWERHVGATQTEMRAALARSGLFEEDMQKKVSSLSGGERAKLALCVLQSQNANFLLLDEPTNHLDLPARESLEEALKKFEGTLLFVSHDRYFLSALADEVFEIEGGKLHTYAGNYQFYMSAKSEEEQKSRAEEEKKERLAEEERKSESFRSKKERAEDARRRERLKKLEEEISSLEEEEKSINVLLIDPAVSCDYREINRLSTRLFEIKNLLDALYSEYGDMI